MHSRPVTDSSSIVLKLECGVIWAGISTWPQFRGRLSLSPSSLLLPDGRLTITVIDFDLDRDGSGNGDFESDGSKETSTVVQVKSCRILRNATEELCEPTGFVEIVTLVESSEAGTFTAVVQTKTRDGIGGDGVLYRAQAGGRVEVEYVDQSGGEFLTANVRVASTAQVRFDQSDLASSSGGACIITVVDQDGEREGLVPRTTFINVSLADSSKAAVVIPLTETGGLTGVFTGGLRTSLFARSNVEFVRYRPLCPHTSLEVTSVTKGASILADYSDFSVLGGSRSPDSAFIVSTILQLTSETGSIQISSSKSPLRVGDMVSITVFDADLNQDASRPEMNIAGLVIVYGHGWACSPGIYPTCSTSVLADGSHMFHSCQGFLAQNHSCLVPQPPCPDGTLGTCSKADWEPVVLSETGCNTGIFTGRVATSADREASAQSDGRLFVRSEADDSTLLRAVYMDALPLGSMNDAYLGVETVGAVTAHGQDLDSSGFSIGESLTVSVVDGDANLDSCTVDFVNLNVSAARSSTRIDTETVVLLETGVNTGRFTGQLATSGAAKSTSPERGTVSDGSLTHLRAEDQVSLVYHDISASGLVRHTIKASHRGDLSHTFSLVLAGGSLHITVADADLNTDEDNVGEIVTGRLRVSTSKDSQTEDVVLKESVLGNMFVGILNTKSELERGRSNSGTLNVGEGDLLTVTYDDASPSSRRSAVIQVATSSSLSVSPSLPAVGEILRVTLSDSDLNTHPLVPDSGTVEVYRQPSSPLYSASYRGTHDTNTERFATFGLVTVTETDTSSGVFTGALLMSARNSPGAPPIESESSQDSSGEILSCLGGDTLTMTYTDQFPYQISRATVSIYARARLSTSGPWITAGTSLTITVTDFDMNQDAKVAEKIANVSGMLYIETDKPRPGDLEYLDATETGIDSGVFTAVILTSSTRTNVQRRNNLRVEPFDAGTYATVTYIDLAPRVNAILRVRSSTIGEIKVSPSRFGSGTNLTITLSDTDLDLDVNASDTATVVATTSKQGEGSERVSLIETGLSTGSFTGLLRTRRSALLGDQDDGEMNLIDGDKVTVTYTDRSPEDQEINVCRDDSKVIMLRERCSLGASACDCYNPRQDQAVVAVFGRMWLDPGSTATNSLAGNFDIYADSILRIGSTMTVTVIDSDLNNLPETTEIYSQINSGPGGDEVVLVKTRQGQQLPLELAESGTSSSIFTAVFSSDDNPAAAAGRVIVGAGAAASSLVTVEYADPTSGTRAATARLQTNAQMSVSSLGSSSTLRVGDSFTVTVTDGDRNLDFDQVDFVTVKIRSHTEYSDAFGETLTLSETNVSTGVFTASMRTALGHRRADRILNCEQPQSKPCTCSQLSGCSECINAEQCTCQSAYVTAIYDDPSPIGIRATASLALKFPGMVSFGAVQAQAAGQISITVDDADLNVDDATYDTASVSMSAVFSSAVNSASIFAQTSILLTETDVSSSTFTASVQLCEGCTSTAAALNIGTQSLGVKRLLRASYADASHLMDSCSQTCDPIGRCVTVCSAAAAVRTTEASVMTLGVLRVSPFTDNANVAEITLYDLNADTTDLPETVNVSVRAMQGGSTVACGSACEQLLELTETGLSTGIFTASLDTHRKVPSCAITSSAICVELSESSVLNISYSDAEPPSLVSVTPQMVCDARLLIERAVSPGRELMITLFDCDMDMSSTAADTVTVDVVSTSGSNHNRVTDREQVILTETALFSATAAVFTGRLPTAAGDYMAADNEMWNATVIARSANDVLYIRTGRNASERASSISVSYTDAFNSAGSSRIRTVNTTVCTSSAVNVSQSLRNLVGEPVTAGYASFSIGVLDIRVDDLARSGLGWTSISIQSLDGFEHEVVQLMEATSGNSSSNIFTGIIGVNGNAMASSSQLDQPLSSPHSSPRPRPHDGSLGPFSSGVCLESA
jgi:hypothetical protein